MNILIVNVHSALNLGDDAIMDETLRSLQRIFPQANITVAANDPTSWHKYTGVTFIGSLTAWVVRNHQGHWRARWFLAPLYLGLLMLAIVSYRLLKTKMQFGALEQRQLLLAYYDADLVLSCGGGNFYAQRVFSPFFICALFSLALAIYLGKRVIMLPQSIGPINGYLQRFLARLVFSRVALMMLRESRAVDFVRQELGVQTQAVLVPDLAFGLSVTPVRIQERSMPLQIGVTITGRIAQRSLARQRIYEHVIETLLIELSRKHRAHLHLFAQCTGPSIDHDDRIITRRLYARLKRHVDQVSLWNTFHDAWGIKAAYAQMDLMIGTRMHTAIFAASGGVPVILIGYQPKAFGVMEELGIGEYCCDIEKIQVEDMYKLVCLLLENQERLRQHLIARYTEMQKRLEGWTRYLET